MSKNKVTDVSAAFDDDDTVSLSDILIRNSNKKNIRSSANLQKNGGSKKQRVAVAHEPTASRPAAAKEVTEVTQWGKSRFYKESIRLTQDVVSGQLFGHVELLLRSRPEDYGEMRVYSGPSSSGEMGSAKEETYRIARSLGIGSWSRLVGNEDYRAVGLLPSQEAVAFADSCSESFAAPELERDILKVPDTTLMEAANYHAISVSINVV